jgi:hypothetical protein
MDLIEKQFTAAAKIAAILVDPGTEFDAEDQEVIIKIVSSVLHLRGDD